ncbi:proline-rich protein HaeIII subfamily 1-like, partial [Eschrichtius robustus]|uniref:proline-rich protein HaeIII subfamily 1-like n=1 Tax=Eschrichtius robustus TaxID=9764 RepID=UPI0035BED908
MKYPSMPHRVQEKEYSQIFHLSTRKKSEDSYLEQGSPTPQEPGRTARGEWRGASEASSAASHHSHYQLNHTPNPPSVEKLSSTKLVPGRETKGRGGRAGAPPPPRLRPPALGPPPGDARPVPPRPHPRRRPGGRSPSALPQTTMPGHSRLLRPRWPRRRHTVPSPGAGRRAGEGVAPPRRGPRSPHTRSGHPERAQWLLCPSPSDGRARRGSAPPLPLRGPARSQAPPRPSPPAAVPAPARTPPRAAQVPASRLASGDPEPPARRPSQARPRRSAPPLHVTVSLAGAERSAAPARLPHPETCAPPAGVDALFSSLRVPAPRCTPQSGRTLVQGLTMLNQDHS